MRRSAVSAGTAAADTIVLGRHTYEEWAAVWPSRRGDGGLGDYINETPKLVATRTLTQLDWDSSSIIEGDVAETIAALKRQPGREIAVTGSGTLVRSLLEAGVVDELRLLLHPIVVGQGKHLFEGGAVPQGLELVESQPFSNGVLNLTYRPATSGNGNEASTTR